MPLSSFAHFTRKTEPLIISHQGIFPAVTLSFNLAPGVALGQAVDAIQAMTDRLHVPPTLNASFQGTAQAFQASLSSMPLLVAAAILVVYIVLGILYESYIHPITILSALPSAGVGALLMLMLLHYELSVIAIVGIILLIGIVKKNAIMMIDFALQAERLEGKSPQEAIHQACLLRFRPIMMTTFAALFGAMPIAFGQGGGAELRQPLGVAIVGGLLVSQWLTLYTTPVIYLYLDRFARWVGRPYRPSRVADALSGEVAAGARAGAPGRGVTTMTRNHVATERVETDAFPAADRTFGFLIHDVSRLLKRRFERAARHTGLPITRRQAAVMLYIARHQGREPGRGCDWLDIEPIALVRMLDKLHEEGLVERRAHPTDRRVRTLWLTPRRRPRRRAHSRHQSGDPRRGVCRARIRHARRDDRRPRQRQRQSDVAGGSGSQRTLGACRRSARRTADRRSSCPPTRRLNKPNNGELRMRRRELLTAPAVVAIATAGPVATPPPVIAGHAALDAMLRPYLAQFGLPALAGAVVRDGRVVAAGALGIRRVGTRIPVTIDDRFHIGSDTKAMTALLAAMLVEAGKLRWDTSVGSAFPELAATMAPGVGGVTLAQLLSHTSGIPSDNPAQDKLFEQSFAQPGNLDELRYWIVTGLVKQQLRSKPGAHFAYSNLGYTLAGAIIERIGGKTWEELVAERVFDPLGLKTAGFGPQSSLGRIDAPLGHRTLPNGMLKAMLAGPNGDNPEAIGPAGTVHLSVLDFAAWAGWHAGAGQARPGAGRPGDVPQAPHHGHRHAAKSGCAGRHAVERQLRARHRASQPADFAGAVFVPWRLERNEPRLHHAAAEIRFRDGDDDQCRRRQGRPGAQGVGGKALQGFRPRPRQHGRSSLRLDQMSV